MTQERMTDDLRQVRSEESKDNRKALLPRFPRQHYGGLTSKGWSTFKGHSPSQKPHNSWMPAVLCPPPPPLAGQLAWPKPLPPRGRANRLLHKTNGSRPRTGHHMFSGDSGTTQLRARTRDTSGLPPCEIATAPDDLHSSLPRWEGGWSRVQANRPHLYKGSRQKRANAVNHASFPTYPLSIHHN
jgi:hypothetical protein